MWIRERQSSDDSKMITFEADRILWKYRTYLEKAQLMQGRTLRIWFSTYVRDAKFSLNINVNLQLIVSLHVNLLWATFYASTIVDFINFKLLKKV